MNIEALQRIISKIEAAEDFERLIYCLGVAYGQCEAARALIHRGIR